MKNLHPLDRLLRLVLAVVMLELAYFWLAGAWQWGAYAAALILAGTAAVRFCPVYRLMGLATARRSTAPWSGAKRALSALLLLALVVGGTYGSAFVTRKLFLEDFNAMNHFYKQTLFLTGKNEREQAVANWEKMMPAFVAFQHKYSTYQPHALKGDRQLVADLKDVARMMAEVEPQVRTGDLHQAHLDLEKIRPVFQEVFKRNGFSLLAVALVDFHDAMERMLDAAQAKNASEVVQLYPSVSDKLKPVEQEANDAEIQTIRKNLDGLLSLAQSGKLDALPAQVDQLKSSFVKVYLKRG